MTRRRKPSHDRLRLVAAGLFTCAGGIGVFVVLQWLGLDDFTHDPAIRYIANLLFLIVVLAAIYLFNDRAGRLRNSIPIPVDALALSAAASGLFIARTRDYLIGAIIYGLSLIALPISLVRFPRWPRVLSFSFAMHFWLLVLSGVTALLFWRSHPIVPMMVLTSWAYHYVGVCLVERQARYSPGGSFGWKTVSRVERPRTYWWLVAGFSTLAAMLLTLLFLFLTDRTRSL